MQLCTRCNGAVDEGRSHCPICDLPVAPTIDPTRVQGASPSAGLAPYAGYAPPPGYAPVPPGYARGYAVPVAPAYPVAAPYKSKAVAAVLCFFFGSLGVHRFYTGQVGLGLALLLTTLILGALTCGLWLVVTFVWVLVDFVLILSGGVSDEWGRPLV